MRSYIVTTEMNDTGQYLRVVLSALCFALVALTPESVDDILKCDRSKERYRAVISCGAVYYAVQGGSNC